MRYFVELAYRGTPFVGWQRQINGLSVQQCLEEAMAQVLGEPITLVGCGRTDAGVHATRYFAHLDTTHKIETVAINRINRLLSDAISVKDLIEVADECHARFGATKRSYQYHLSGSRDPFRQDLVYAFYGFDSLNRQKMVDAADIIKQYQAFLPFCKSNSDVHHYNCTIFESQWHEKQETGELVYRISANRFLRGMVRLIVGMCIQVGLDKMSLAEVTAALVDQKPLPQPLSAPAQGLFLTDVAYPFLTRES